MKVVIVAKTRMGSGACIGGITFNGRSVRLIAHDQEWNDQFNQEYNVGDVWDVDYSEPDDLLPPHVENIIVRDKRKHPPLNDLVSFIKTHMPPKEGGLDMLYEGMTGHTKAGALYVTERLGVPSYSTMFWRPDQPLKRDDDGKRIRYRYPAADGGRTLTFVGYQEPPPEIPAGAILRVSLAHWWRPDEMPEGELRCYVQLSGWFLPAEPDTTGEENVAHSPVVSSSYPLPPDADPQTLLKQVFGFDRFLPLQQTIINNLLSGQETLAVMPTGSGKSLCYQLPALLFPGLTVVVSPLISLMADQVAAMRAVGVPAVALNSSLSFSEYRDRVSAIRAGRVKLLYAAPETLLRPETLIMLEGIRVDCLAIDEAHCISEWGHDFRPEYRRLTEAQRRLPDAVTLALTATATQRVREDIKDSLGIPDAAAYVASFDRENLFLAVEPKTDLLAQTLTFLNAHRDESGIVYCTTRRRVDELTEQLQANGRHALPYHAGLDSGTRRRHQRQFSRDDVPIIVATIAFGMGIDKSNVRFILHVDLPKNLESYYQQIGRAGRDGLRADCLLLYSYSDVDTINYFIRQKPDEQQRGARMRRDAMLGFVETADCRRRPLLNYFNEAYEADNCEMCDNCTAEAEDLTDLTVPAQKFLSCVKRTGEIFGVNHVIKVLRGSRAKGVLKRGHDKLSTYNIGGEFSKKQWKYLARHFLQQGLMERDPQYGGLSLTEKAYAVFRGEEKVWGTLPDQARRQTAVSPDHDAALFNQLRAKRKELADAADLPPYTIFHDRTLVEMATYFPQSKAAFAQLYGVGKVKLEKYAGEFLPIIRAYCAENGIEEKQRIVRAAPSGGKKRRHEVAELFNDGHTVPEIAAHFGVKRRTVLKHLWRTVQAGERLHGADGLLDLCEATPAEQEEALGAFAAHGPDYLRPVYDALEERVSFDDLHLLRLHFAITHDE